MAQNDAQSSFEGEESRQQLISSDRDMSEINRILRSTVISLSQIIWCYRPTGPNHTFDRVSAMWWCGFTGQSEAERSAAGGMGWLDAVHPEDRQTARDYWLNTLIVNEATSAEFRVRRHDGSWRWLLVRGMPVREKGVVDEWAGSTLDITERKEAEIALRTSEQEFRSLAEAMPQIVWATRADGWNIYFNKQWVDYTGLSLAESYGHGWNTPFHPDDRKRAWDAWQRATQENATYSLECRLKRFDGTYRWWLIRGVPLRDADGKILKWFGTCTDIEDLKLAMDRLKVSEQMALTNQTLLMEAQRIAHLGNWQWDAINNVVWWSDELYRMYGKEPSTSRATYEEDQRNYTPESAALLDQAVNKALQEGVPYEIELELNRPAGSPKWVLARGEATRDASGKIVGLRGTVQDITNRKLVDAKHQALEAQLRQAQKMQAVGTLAGGIAHDFNNILCGVLGHTELLDGIASASQKRHLAAIRTAVDRASDLVKQLLAFSRAKSMEKRVVRFDRTIDESLKLLHASIPASVTFKVTLGCGDSNVLADVTQLHQVTMNLVTNAWQSMKGRSGQIQIRTDTFEIDAVSRNEYGALPPGHYLRLQVWDNGSGIAPEIVSRIFDPFFTTKAPGEGSGLGLAVVHGIVREHGGAISVQSEVEGGTRFQVLFPVARERSLDNEIPEKPALRGRGEHLLLVDDEVEVITFAPEALSQLGYSITVCDSSENALSILCDTGTACDLLITDLAMPGMTGLELIREARRSRPTLSALLMTGYADAKTVAEVKRLGIHLVEKPWKIAEMAKVIGATLNHAGAKNNSDV